MGIISLKFVTNTINDSSTIVFEKNSILFLQYSSEWIANIIEQAVEQTKLNDLLNNIVITISYPLKKEHIHFILYVFQFIKDTQKSSSDIFHRHVLSEDEINEQVTYFMSKQLEDYILCYVDSLIMKLSKNEIDNYYIALIQILDVLDLKSFLTSLSNFLSPTIFHQYVEQIKTNQRIDIEKHCTIRIQQD